MHLEHEAPFDLESYMEVAIVLADLAVAVCWVWGAMMLGVLMVAGRFR